jgi:hypothetical protein
VASRAASQGIRRCRRGDASRRWTPTSSSGTSSSGPASPPGSRPATRRRWSPASPRTSTSPRGSGRDALPRRSGGEPGLRWCVRWVVTPAALPSLVLVLGRRPAHPGPSGKLNRSNVARRTSALQPGRAGSRYRPVQCAPGRRSGRGCARAGAGAAPHIGMATGTIHGRSARQRRGAGGGPGAGCRWEPGRSPRPGRAPAARTTARSRPPGRSLPRPPAPVCRPHGP